MRTRFGLGRGLFFPVRNICRPHSTQTGELQAQLPGMGARTGATGS